MVGIATAGSTLGNLVLLPACLTLGDRLGNRKRPAAVFGLGCGVKGVGWLSRVQ